MKKVARDELLELGAYEQVRERFRARVIADKKARRFSPSSELSVVFENHDTALFQIQEMLRTERITAEPAIQHELATYNELVPADGELSATVFLEIADRETRDRRLMELAGLERAIFLEFGGVEVAAVGEARGDLTDRTTAVHYLKFPLGPAGLARLGRAAAGDGQALFTVRHPHLAVRAVVPATVLTSLVADIGPPDPV